MSDNAAALKQLLDKHASPPPEIVSSLPKGGTTLDFVGHAETTRILIEEDPEWSWEPQAWDPAGGPLVVQRGNLLVLWGHMTVHGKTLPCVGTCEAKKVEADKELIGDLIRNGAMRFGIALNLWSKAEKAEEGYQPPASQDFHGWDSKKLHDLAWETVKGNLLALPDAAKDAAVRELLKAKLFELNKDNKRVPVLPFTPSRMKDAAAIVALATNVVADEAVTAPAQRPQHAIDTLADARDCDPLTAEGIEEWHWELASHANADEIPWKSYTGKDRTGLRMQAILDKARELASDLTVKGITTDVPDRLDDIHGELAVALRLALLAYDAGKPF